MPIIFERFLSVVVGVPSALISWQIRRRSVGTVASTTTLSIVVLECFVLLDQFISDGHIFTLDHVNDDLAILDQFKVLARLLLDHRLELAALLEKLVAKGHEEICVVRKHLFFDDTGISGTAFLGLIRVRLLPLFNLIKDQLASTQGVQVHQIEQIVQFVFVAIFLRLLLLVDHFLQMNHVSLIPEQLLKLFQVETRSHGVDELALHHRDAHFAEAGMVLGSRLEQLVAEGLDLRQ